MATAVNKNVNIQDTDFEWFLENYSELFKQYGEAYLVIKDEEVIGVYNDFNNAIDTTLLTEEIGTFIVQKCDGTESAYTLHIASMNFM
jgi:hypothetical protein